MFPKELDIIGSNELSTGTPRFTALRRYCLFTSSMFVATLSRTKSIGARSPRVLAYYVSVSHFDNSQNISKLFIMFVMVIDLKMLRLHKTHS